MLRETIKRVLPGDWVPARSPQGYQRFENDFFNGKVFELTGFGDLRAGWALLASAQE